MAARSWPSCASGGWRNKRCKLRSTFPPCRVLRRQDPERHEAIRSASRAANDVRTGREYGNCQGTRRQDSTVDTGAGDQGHRVMNANGRFPRFWADARRSADGQMLPIPVTFYFPENRSARLVFSPGLFWLYACCLDRPAPAPGLGADKLRELLRRAANHVGALSNEPLAKLRGV